MLLPGAVGSDNEPMSDTRTAYHTLKDQIDTVPLPLSPEERLARFSALQQFYLDNLSVFEQPIAVAGGWDNEKNFNDEQLFYPWKGVLIDRVLLREIEQRNKTLPGVDPQIITLERWGNDLFYAPSRQTYVLVRVDQKHTTTHSRDIFKLSYSSAVELSPEQIRESITAPHWRASDPLETMVDLYECVPAYLKDIEKGMPFSIQSALPK